MTIEYHNDKWIEEAHMNFEEALENEDFETARAVLGDIEQYRLGDTYEFRRKMNLAMGKEEKAEYGTYTPMDSDMVDRHITNFHD